MTPTSRRPTPRDRLTGLAALLTITAAVIGLPTALLALDATPTRWHVPTGVELTSALTAPDTGGLALAALTLLAWLAWAALTASLLLEAGARLRHTRTPHLPGLTLPQTAARALVTAAILLFTAAPALTIPQPALATPAPAGPRAPSGLVAAVPAHPATPPTSDHADRPVPGARTHTVTRGESLWSIAADELDDGRRWPEIAALNPDRTHGPEHTLWTGTVLHLPATHPTTGTGHTVRTGDTLSGIARDRLGDPDRWPEIYDASKATTQPDGRHLSDPDLILPGWHLTLPTAATATAPLETTARTPLRAVPDPTPPRPSTTGTRPSDRGDRPAAPTGTPAAAPTAGTVLSDRDRDRAPAETARDDTPPAEPGPPPWMLTGLAGGTVLAASMWMLLRHRRATQSRHRRPGRTLPTPPPQLAPVEKTLATLGPPAQPGIDHLDTVLRHLATAQAAARAPMPALATVELTPAGTTLHLNTPATLPAPWQDAGDATRWHLPASTEPADLGPLATDQPAPYPLLATVGTTETGHTWLYNYEDQIVALTGDPDYAADYARYLAAEIACNPWSSGVHLDCVGVATETAPLNPDRIHPHPINETGVIGQVLAVAVSTTDRATDAHLDGVTARAHQAGADTWPARMLLWDSTAAAPRDDLDTLLELLTAHAGTTGTSIVLNGTADTPAGAVAIELTATGRSRFPSAGLDLVAVGLTADEARGCAALLASGADLADEPIPVDENATDGWRAVTDVAGALRAAHVIPRHTAPEDLPVGTTTVLDAPDEDYLREAATTRGDLAALAPHVPTETRMRVDQADPTLDDDVALWFADDCPLPRLTLLGPVRARTRGRALAERKAYMTAVLAYLATRPHGATPDELAVAFSVSPAKARVYAGTVRDWLGTNPRTGHPHLPDARLAPAAAARGVPVYQVQDVLVDADLFRRLRARGQAHGNAGIPDLIRALDLVTGEPFSQLRPGAWSWLYDGDRLDQHVTCAVVGVAHLIVTEALHKSDLSTARRAAHIEHQAAPSEDIPLLDLAAVADAEGHISDRDQLVQRVVLQVGQGQSPTDLSDRTTDVIRERNWDGEQSAAS